MIKNTASLALVLAVSLAAPMALAEDAAPTATPAPAAEAPAPAAEAPAAEAPAEPYVKTTEGDWKVQCIRVESGDEPCEMFQLLTDKDGNKVASISVLGLPKGKEAVAGATIATPLESALTAGVTLQIDTQKPITLPYSFCSQVGCFSNVVLKAEELDLFKKGKKIAMTIVPMRAPDQKVELEISLKGFSAAWDAMQPK
ncbi:invasion associated locus B family protein [Rhodobacter capsulatus]|uniref:invasion associated locus B family protein n=1 Tax=Rhodobacter capsulatus TaxID=1061 RepID=UPI0006DC586A|nr:invasion associated locus B family protein [Rhodobacter capsulatus]KQB17118.1 invasion associated locus B family protein [Rhodobacter capsulatus]KQB17516.1 invasion associated locus B family protein [Rhodobacter capsulatus]PZX27509.1 invasion protein IalB [Rhodobacter capsulatus]QNR64582.1 invasion associated locus B family protein [Rhodobacter capsulatus]